MAFVVKLRIGSFASHGDVGERDTAQPSVMPRFWSESKATILSWSMVIEVVSAVVKG